MTHPLVVIGAGGFGREVLDVVEAVNQAAGSSVFDVVGVLDDSPSQVNLDRLEARGVDYLGSVDEIGPQFDGLQYSVGVGSPAVRRELAERAESNGAVAATLVHPSATFGALVTVSEGAVICAGVRITTNVTIGRHVHLNLNSTVGHDTRLGDFVSVNPLASISGDCVVEDEVLIGVAGVLLNGIRVGRGATVGGSACVVKDVPPGVIVKGIPAR